MAQLPADRTKLALAQSNQVPSAVASSQRNKDAITEAYDTIDMLHGFAQTQLGLRYSKAETDALLLANKTGDHTGTWQGYTPSQVSASIVQQNLDALTKEVAKTVNLLGYGGVADANYFNPTTKDWYKDAGFTQLATDNRAALINCISVAVANGIKKIFIPGKFAIRGSAINITSDSFTIEGNDITSSLLGFTSANGGLLLKNGENYMYEIKIKNIGIDGGSIANTAIQTYKCEQFESENLAIQNFVGNPLILEKQNLTHFKRFTLLDCPRGIILKNCGYLSFYNHNIYNVLTSVFTIQGSLGQLNVLDGWFETFDNLFNVEEEPLNFISVGTINVHHNYVLNTRNNMKLLDVKNGTLTNAVLVKFNFTKNRVVYTGTTNSLVNVEYTNTANVFNVHINDNEFELSAALTSTPVISSVPLSYMLNVTFESNYGLFLKNIITGNGQVVGIDSYAGQNVIRGLLNLLGDPSTIESTIYYDNASKRIALHTGSGYSVIPVQAGNIPLSVATDVATLKTDVNNLITQLKASKIIT